MKCAICGKEIDERQELDQRATNTPQGPVHEDCYYDKLGEEIEKYPIGGHLRPRGRGQAIDTEEK